MGAFSTLLSELKFWGLSSKGTVWQVTQGWLVIAALQKGQTSSRPSGGSDAVSPPGNCGQLCHRVDKLSVFIGSPVISKLPKFSDDKAKKLEEGGRQKMKTRDNAVIMQGLPASDTSSEKPNPTHQNIGAVQMRIKSANSHHDRHSQSKSMILSENVKVKEPYPTTNVDTSHMCESRDNREDNMVDEEEEENGRQASYGSILPESQEIFLTLELCGSQDITVIDHDAGETTSVSFGMSSTPESRLLLIRRRRKRMQEDMFTEIMNASGTADTELRA
ncbi:Rho GTPase-activating protein 15 [Chelonia mydas]|uniref:Rho GTPase-activating protein 15 n=1 Tax=Chelonia mydas TaxID=8469 RepID=M7C0S6_CHEMY|nr:Rho GTPase-activating protein 15 [Chelonia mydas]